jgi:gas vesicle protein
MFSRVRIAIRFFFVGLAVGVLLAPRAGIETRRLLRQRADRLVNDLLEAASMSGPPSGTKTDGAATRRSTTRKAETSSSEAAGAVVGGD